MPTVITTPRLLIKPRNIGDIEACMAMDRDPMVTKHIAGPWHDPKRHRQFIEEKMAQTYPHPFGYWSIYEAAYPEEFLGWVMLIPLNEDCSKAEIGWRLTKKSWGHGIATEATQQVMKLAFAEKTNLEIIAIIAPDNHGSIKVAENVGLAFNGCEMSDGVRELVYTVDSIGK